MMFNIIYSCLIHKALDADRKVIQQFVKELFEDLMVQK